MQRGKKNHDLSESVTTVAGPVYEIYIRALCNDNEQKEREMRSLTVTDGQVSVGLRCNVSCEVEALWNYAGITVYI